MRTNLLNTENKPEIPLKGLDRSKSLNFEIFSGITILVFYIGYYFISQSSSINIVPYIFWLIFMIISLAVNKWLNHYYSFLLFQSVNIIAIIGLVFSFGNDTLLYNYLLVMAFTSFVQYRFKTVPFVLFTSIGLILYIIMGAVEIEGVYELLGSREYWRWANLIITTSLLAFQLIQLRTGYTHSIAAAESREKQNETLFNETPIGIALLDLEDKNSSVRVNKGLTEILGLSQNEALNTNLLSVSPQMQSNGKSSESYLSEILKTYRKEREATNFNWTLQIRDKVIESEIYLKPFPSVNKERLDLMMVRDITETKLANKKIDEIQDLIDIMFDISTDGVEYYVEESATKKLLTYRSNENLRKMLVMTESELQDAILDDISPKFQLNGEDSASYMAKVTKQLRSKGKIKYEWRFINTENKIVDVEVSAVGKNKDGIYSYLAIFRDITEQKIAQRKITDQVEELNDKNEELEKYIESNMQLENFAYIASHDLKSPIRTIISFSQLLSNRLKDKLSEEEKEYMNFIISGSKSMQRLIDDLLTYAKIEFVEGSIEQISPKLLLGDLLISNSIEINEKKAEISIGHLPEIIFADKTGLAQVFQNLILNGLKFVKDGEKPIIKIDSSETESHWIFSVADNGIGIKKEYFDRIFLIFKKLNKQEEFEGTGIGLSVCQKITQQHRGKIWLESEFGEGTTFYFSIAKNLSPSLPK